MKFLDSVKEFLTKNNFPIKEESCSLDKALLELSQSQVEQTEPLLALRCRVSHTIAEKVVLMFSEKRAFYDLEINDMLICVLDDVGDLFLRVPQNDEKGSIQYQRQRFNWSTISSLSFKQIKPYGADIIFHFKPGLSNLSSWTKRKVNSNSELKSYLRHKGCLLISDWALLADSSSRRIKESWQLYCSGSTNLSINDVEKLHQSYLMNYKQAKANYRKVTGRQSGWEPDKDFLASLEPTQNNVEQLIAMATAIRRYLGGVDIRTNRTQLNEELIYEAQPSNDYLPSEDLLKQIEESLEQFGLPLAKEAIEADCSKWEKDPSRKLAWELYGQGLGQRDIAARCNHKQGWVSKLLEEKFLSESIAQEAAIALVRRPEFHQIKKDPEGLDRMIEQLRNHLVSSEQEGDIPPLRQMIQTALKYA
ncbi:hypothetical protein EV05_0007 [Prochlorococcus sp. MIT 0601]|nr:hypothetical protein EV05_0007 [Prochlorococcus sp. MIT 0601]